MPPLITIAIPTYQREEVLVDTLRQLLSHADPRVDLLVVDQTLQHDPATEEMLKEQVRAGSLRRVLLQPPSLTAARNRALQEALAPVVLFLDDDIRVPPSLVDEHLRHYADPAVAAVTGQVFNCRDPEQPPPLDDPRRGTVPHSSVEVVCPANNVSGGNHSVRRAVALAIGGYDVAFRGSALGEDMDFSRRLMSAGHRILYNPAAWIIHLGVKRGGCAVGEGSGWPEWQYSAGLLLYGFRHSRRQGNGWEILRMALRNGPLRKDVVVHPARWPSAWWGFARALQYGWRHRRFVAPSRAPGAHG